MPLLLVILVVLAIRSLTLPGGMEGVAYLFQPDFTRLSGGRHPRRARAGALQPQPGHGAP